MRNILKFAFLLVFISACGSSKNTTTTEPLKDVSESSFFSTGTETKKETKTDEIVTQPIYQATRTILTDLIHTKLRVDFNWEKSEMNGTATLTLSPHFYPQDSLILDAQSMEIISVEKDGKPLSFHYKDAKKLRIKLDKTYTRNDKYDVVIRYIAKPETKEKGGSSAISDDKGLYFINPKGENKNQMPQIWTQGETQANSVWFPTFDSPNFKSTQEIFIIVEDKYKTLSNGKLISSQKNDDGTRTDHWKQDLPHAPYLFMMTIGEFSIVEDSYTKSDGTKIPVNYYVEPEWEEYAKDIFGVTPKMIEYFSKLVGVEYPWDKYHQVVVREYVSGAMENTSASLFGDFLYKTKRELLDADDHSIIAHELFHHWFGNLVTAESWSNLPLNESFANYSQYLWDEYYKGVDEADYNAEKERDGYFQSANVQGHHPMIWYDYNHREQMFDGHAYNKGGRILHMLRTYLGDDAFFGGLKIYLEKNAFTAAELAHLRLAFEEISGEDLNWFFNQWFFNERHPELRVTQEISEGEVVVKIDQTQDFETTPLYQLPLKIAVFSGGKKILYEIVVDKNKNTFTFPFSGELENIVVDEDAALLGKITHQKPREWYLHQFYNTTKFAHRKDALNFGTRSQKEEAKQMILDALNDKFWRIRQLGITKLDKFGSDEKQKVFELLKEMAKSDENSKVRSTALSTLTTQFFKNETEKEVRELLNHAIHNDLSYLIVSSSLNNLTKGTEDDKKSALTLAKSLEKEPSSSLKAQIIDLYKNYGDVSHLDFMADALTSGIISGYDIISGSMSFANFLSKQETSTQLKYFYVIEDLAKSGGAYIDAILPAIIMNMKQDVDQKTIAIQEEINEKGSNSKLENKQKEIEKLNKRIVDLISKMRK